MFYHFNYSCYSTGPTLTSREEALLKRIMSKGDVSHKSGASRSDTESSNEFDHFASHGRSKRMSRVPCSTRRPRKLEKPLGPTLDQATKSKNTVHCDNCHINKCLCTVREFISILNCLVSFSGLEFSSQSPAPPRPLPPFPWRRGLW